MCIRDSDANGDSWGEPIVIAEMYQFPGNVISAAIVNGHPAIAYFSWTDSKVKYVRALDANGDSWGSPINLGNWISPSLLVVNGKPAVCCSGVIYVRALDANGETWGTPVNVTPEWGYWTQMFLVNGCPAITCDARVPELDTHVLKYVRALDADGNSWGETITVSSDIDTRMNSALVVHGHPAIAYEWHHGDYSHLKYVKATDPDGTNWRPPVIVDEASLSYPCLNTVNGCPAISYIDGIQIKFAIYY